LKQVVINRCYGGFGLSDEAYQKLIEWGVPVRRYTEEPRNPKTGLYDKKPKENEGEAIFDRELTLLGESKMNDLYHKFKPNDITGRYWETWLGDNREHPLLIRVVKELKKKASGRYADLKIVRIPDDVDYAISEYDGLEHIAEKHRSWS
jgi:hypothetical protein